MLILVSPCLTDIEIGSRTIELMRSDRFTFIDGYGLGNVWPTVSNGALSASGQAYLSALQAR